MKILYVACKVNKNDALYGKTHGADNVKTLCGKIIDSNWYILNHKEPSLKHISCKKCLKLLDIH